MHIPSLRPVLAALFALLFLNACETTVPPLAENPYAAPTYRLSPSDRLQVTVFGEDALSREYVITSAGDVSFPLLGDVPAAGKSVPELTNEITDQLSQGYINDPRVNIEVLNYRPIYVLGEVEKSGEFKYTPELTAVQAIALAGGFTYRADRGRLFIRRAGEDRELTYEIDSGRTVFVLPGDTIRVGERYF